MLDYEYYEYNEDWLWIYIWLWRLWITFQNSDTVISYLNRVKEDIYISKLENV